MLRYQKLVKHAMYPSPTITAGWGGGGRIGNDILLRENDISFGEIIIAWNKILFRKKEFHCKGMQNLCLSTKH